MVTLHTVGKENQGNPLHWGNSITLLQSVLVFPHNWLLTQQNTTSGQPTCLACNTVFPNWLSLISVACCSREGRIVCSSSVLLVCVFILACLLSFKCSNFQLPRRTELGRVSERRGSNDERPSASVLPGEAHASSHRGQQEREWVVTKKHKLAVSVCSSSAW